MIPGFTAGGNLDVIHPIPGDSLIWQRADDIAGNDGDAVAAWNNHAGNGNNFLQATAGNKPLLKKGANGFNGHNVVRFDGVDDFVAFTGTIATSGKDMTTIYVLSCDSTATQTNMVLVPNSDWGPSGFGMFFYGDGGGGVNDQSLGLTYTGIAMGANPAGENAKVWVSYRKDSTGWTITTSAGGSLTPADNADVKLINPMIGWSSARSGTYQGFPGAIAELIVWNRRLTNTENSNVIANLTVRYGI